MSDDLEIPDARSISVHLVYLRKELDQIARTMATKDDLASLRAEMAGYAKASSVELLERRVDSLETSSKQGSLGETAKRLANGFLLAFAVATAIASIIGATVAAVHWFDAAQAKVK